jgi:hypothetical protein
VEFGFAPPDLPTLGEDRDACRVRSHFRGPNSSAYDLWFEAAAAVELVVTMPLEWHTYGMTRIRVSTTVDQGLLSKARALKIGPTDAALLDEALKALLARHRAGEIDAAYAVYDQHPLEEPDAWGDLAAFRKAAARK